MTAKISNYKDVLYSREYSNDITLQTDLAKRVALAAVPFLSLHPSLRFPVSIAMGTLRVWKADHKDRVETTVAVIALVSSLFQHRAGMIATTIQDIIIEINKAYQGEREVAKSLIKIVNNPVYLALIAQGGLELSIVAFAIQAVVNLIQSREEFKNGRWIEAVANLLMAAVRLQQSHTQYQQLKRNWEIEAAIKKIFVGNLPEKFRIINSHIPGDPNKPGREEFARYVHKQHREGSITIALGDNNFERDEMIDAYRKAGFSDFSLHSPWKTNISPDTKESKGIDHFFVVGDDTSRDLRSDEVLIGGNLQETIDLLNRANS